MMIRVTLADDQEVVRAGLRLILEAHDDICVVAEADDGRGAIEQVLEHKPDVALLDIRMPGIDGIEATRQITAAGSESRVLILTMYGLEGNVYDALRAGASGFLLKTDSPQQLVDGVRVVATGDQMLAPTVTRALVERFVSGAHPDTAVDSFDLTDRELDVLRLVARGQSNAEIASKLFISEGTVKTHVARILAKLGVRDRTQAVVLAYEHGIVRPGQT
ncbi:MAG TPA: response regulator transcription factor [Mycobacteriales bacterium]|nr:response regulator transcription factor [Mycobacteriales bacterium]